MSRFEIITTTECEKWNGIVKDFEQYEVFYLCEYVKAFEMQGTDKGLLLWYDDGDTKAMNVVFKRDVSDAEGLKGKVEPGQYYDFQTPYGYGGMIIEGSNVQEVWAEYKKLCEEENIICEFIRFGLFSHGETYYDGDVESRTHNIVRNLEVPMDDMLFDFEHKVRKNLKKSERNGLEIVIDERGEFFEDFLNIYYDTMERNQAKEDYFFSHSFFECFRDMKDNAAWFHVRKDGRIVSTELVIYNENNCYSYLGGTFAEYFEFRPNELLKVEIMKWAQRKGIKNFVLGGGYGEDDGIFRYKKSFAPNGVVNFYIGTKILNREMYDRLVDISKQQANFDADTRYFPQYRG